MKQPVNVINSDPDYMMGWKSGQPVLVPKNGDGDIATFATDPLTGAVTGLVGPGGETVGFQKRVGSDSRMTNTGARAYSWGTLSANSHTNGGAVQSGTQFGGTSVAYIPYNASRARVDGTISVALDLSGFKNFGVHITKTGLAPSIMRVYVSGDAFSTSASWDIYVLPGTHYYYLPAHGAVLSGFTWATQGASINRFRMMDVSASIEAGASYSGLLAGESYTCSEITVGARARACLLVQTDDGLAANTRGASLRTGYPASGATYLEIASYYGIRCTAYIIPELVGTNDALYANHDDLKTLLNAGWVLGTHSNAGSSNGLVDLGSEEAVYAEVTAEYNALRAFGYIPDEHLRHFSAPQGGFNYFVAAALDRIPQLRTVRGIGGVNGASYAALTMPGMLSAISTGNKVVRDTGSAMLIKSSQQIDGALTTTDHDNYLANLVAVGGVGSCYTHSISSGIATNFDYFCNAAAALRAAGKLDIMTVDEYYRSTLRALY